MVHAGVSIASGRSGGRRAVSGASGYADFDRLLGAIYEGPMEATPWHSALQILHERLDAAHVALILRPASAQVTPAIINTGPSDPGMMQSYERHFFTLDSLVRLQEGDVVIAEEAIGRQWMRSSFYQDYLRPADVRHLMGTDIYPAEGIECRLRVTRHHGTRPFSREDQALCGRIVPHLKRAIQLHSRMDCLEARHQLLMNTVARARLGIVSFDQTGQLLGMNPEARRLLDERDGIGLRGNTLYVENLSEERELMRLIRQMLGQARPGDSVAAIEGLSITRPSGRSKLGVLVRSVPQGRFDRRQRPAVAMFLRDSEASSAATDVEVVRRLFGLTRTEAALAQVLTEGLAVNDVAKRMNICRNTARTHLRSIFFKTGVTRQTQLVRLLLNSVATLA